MNVEFVAAEGDPAWEIAGLAVAERTRRAFDVAGVDAAKSGSGPRLVLARDALLEPGAVAALCVRDDPEQALVAREGGGAAAARLPEDVPVPVDARELAQTVERLRSQGRVVEADTDGARCRRIRTRDEAQRVERAMIGSLVQPTDGFFARVFDRHISIRLSLIFLRWGLSPNAITIVATLVGLLGAWLIASAAAPLQVTGALLFVFSTILDGCDGEVARLGFRQSEFGRKLDLAGDNVVNVAVFAAVGWVAVTQGGGSAVRFAVAATLFGVVFASAAGFWYSAWLERSGRDPDALHAYESLASRDWAYLVLALAVFGKLPWLIWAAALGSNAVGVLLIVLRLRGWPPLPAVEPESAAASPAPPEPGAADSEPGAASADSGWA